MQGLQAEHSGADALWVLVTARESGALPLPGVLAAAVRRLHGVTVPPALMAEAEGAGRERRRAARRCAGRAVTASAGTPRARATLLQVVGLNDERPGLRALRRLSEARPRVCAAGSPG